MCVYVCVPTGAHQVLAAGLEAIKRCEENEPIRRLWDHQPLVQAGGAGQQSQQQHQRVAGKHAEVQCASPVKQQQQQQRMVLQQQQQQQHLEDNQGL